MIEETEIRSMGSEPSSESVYSFMYHSRRHIYLHKSADVPIAWGFLMDLDSSRTNCVRLLSAMPFFCGHLSRLVLKGSML